MAVSMLWRGDVESKDVHASLSKIQTSKTVQVGSTAALMQPTKSIELSDVSRATSLGLASRAC